MRVFMLGIAVAVAALMPSFSMANDQQIADFVKAKLQMEQQNGNLSGFNVDMRVDNGAVWFSGFVSNVDQEQLILKTAQQAGHLGVVQVVDDIEIRPAAAKVETPAAAPAAQVAYQQPETSPSQVQFAQAPVQQAMPTQMIQQRPMQALPAANAGNQPLAFASSSNMVQPENMGPRAMGAGGMGPGAMGMGQPNLPGYAWPATAAHPNYAAVTYPKQYSAQAWPYIGPFYPYPQVPLGWRKVSLEWDDGWWYLDFNDTNQW